MGSVFWSSSVYYVLKIDILCQLKFVCTMSFVFVLSCRFRVTANGLALGEEADFGAQMFNKPQMLIEVQMFNLPRQPCFCQTDVSG